MDGKGHGQRSNHSQGTNTGAETTETMSFKKLVQRVRRGDTEAVLLLQKTLDQHPELWQKLGNIAAMTRSVVIKSLANGDRLLEESIERKADEMEQELTTEGVTPLYRLAVQRFVATWLQLQHADAAAAKSSNGSLQQAKFWAHRQDQAGKRYERALKTLLLLPKSSPEKSDEKSADANSKDIVLKMAGQF